MFTKIVHVYEYVYVCVAFFCIHNATHMYICMYMKNFTELRRQMQRRGFILG
jgi:hypothetical protein